MKSITSMKNRANMSTTPTLKLRTDMNNSIALLDSINKKNSSDLENRKIMKIAPT
jgi:hypothetical protein